MVHRSLVKAIMIQQTTQILIQMRIKSKQQSIRHPVPCASPVIIVPLLVWRSLLHVQLETIVLLARSDLKNATLEHTWMRQRHGHRRNVNLAQQDIIVQHVAWRWRQRLTRLALQLMH